MHAVSIGIRFKKYRINITQKSLSRALGCVLCGLVRHVLGRDTLLWSTFWGFLAVLWSAIATTMSCLPCSFISRRGTFCY